MTNQEYAHKEFADKYQEWRVEEDHTRAEIAAAEEEADFWDDPMHFQRSYFGRMSPFVKEQIYKEYQAGTSVKNLSLKFGILQQRVKAIVYQKHLYWEEVYPKLGETHMRLAMEREATYAGEYPFVEYGLDLHIMAEYEKGIKVVKLSATDYDSNPTSENKRGMDYFFETQRPRKNDRIPMKLIGRGGDSYMIQDWVIHRGKGAPRVSETFRNITKFFNTKNETRLKTKIRQRMREGGIRYASLGDKYSS